MSKIKFCLYLVPYYLVMMPLVVVWMILESINEGDK